MQDPELSQAVAIQVHDGIVFLFTESTQVVHIVDELHSVQGYTHTIIIYLNN